MSRIAVLFHERDRKPSMYVVHIFADIWRGMGHEVIYLRGPRRFIPADLLFMHVNTSLVPEKYRRFAAQYPRVVNLHAIDIRKRRISNHLVRPDDGWGGPVIVKSDLNSGGEPERRWRRWPLEGRLLGVGRLRRLVDRLSGRERHVSGLKHYRIFDAVTEVPGEYFRDKNVVVEKFLPERIDDLYFTRSYQTLGDRWTCARYGSEQPIVKTESAVNTTDVEPPGDMAELCAKYGLEYGKIDYVTYEGQTVVLDVNKTMGVSRRLNTDPETQERRRHLAAGISAFLP